MFTGLASAATVRKIRILSVKNTKSTTQDWWECGGSSDNGSDEFYVYIESGGEAYYANVVPR